MPLAGKVADNFVIKSRPDSYKASDAAYTTGGNGGFYLAAYPEDYPLTSQQKAVRDAAKNCDIEAGIDKSTLQKKMKNCIPDQF